mgnify:FL=1
MPSTVSFLTKMSYLIAPSVIQSVQRSAFQRVQDELAICFQSKVISERMEVISCAKFKQRAVIEFLVAEGCEPIEIHRRLLNVFGNETVDVSTVRRWVLRAKNSDRGKLNISDADRSGRPVTVSTDENRDRVSALINDNRRITQREIAALLSISLDRVCHLVDSLGYRKISARWVPKMLTPEMKARRVEVCRELLDRFEREGDLFLGEIATGDESWAYHYDPECKQQSMEYRRPSSPPPVKFKRAKSAGKVMLTVFWDSKGVLLSEFLERGNTVNSPVYCNTLQNLKRRIRRIRPDRSTFLLHHDNARPHCSRETLGKIDRLKFEVLPHPPYSPDLAPCDFWLFPELKKYLKGIHFESDDELKRAVETWFKMQPLEFFANGFQKWVSRWRKCIDLNGDYVEKQ